MKIRKEKGLTFDDVLLVPKRSSIASRNDVDTAAWLTPKLPLHIPIVSANMDTVTEASMAIALARNGGIGIIHRFMTGERQARQVERVKRLQGMSVEETYTIAPAALVSEAKQLMVQHSVGGLLVVDEADTLLGLVTTRDLLLVPPHIQTVAEAMTPVSRLTTVTPNVTHAEAQAILYEHRVEKLPVVDVQGKVVGLITARDLAAATSKAAATDARGRLLVGAAIGVTKGEIERAEAVLAAGADALVLDIAHGHADHCIEMVRTLRRAFPSCQIIAGNVATADGARDLAEAGADAIKVGIGPGSICTTRIVTGFGVPQITAILDAAAGLHGAGIDIPIIADGGIRTAGDVVKALAAGASTVMIGSLFAGCEEAPGAAVIRNGQKFKVVRGMASLGAAMSRRAVEDGGEVADDAPQDWDKVIPEGVEAVVPYRGHVAEILHQLVGGLRSGLSYGGAHCIAELQRNAEFIEISQAGVRESGSHDVDRI